MSDLNTTNPTSLSHLIGQRGVIDQVSVALDAAQIDGTRFEHALLVGPPGLGKSALANVVAMEMATEFREVLGQSITNLGDLNALLLAAEDRSVIHIDEAHELGKEYQTALFLCLDKRQIFLGRSGKTPQAIPLADFSLLMSTTDEYKLLAPLRDRMKLLLRFEFYTVEDLIRLVKQRCCAMNWEIEDYVPILIAQRSRGTPRLALRLMQSCRRVCRAEGENRITFDTLDRACELEHIDAAGLGPLEQSYVRLLGDGAIRLNILASSLGLPAKTLSEVIEPFLVRIGLITKDDQGRRDLTAQGHEHLAYLRRQSI